MPLMTLGNILRALIVSHRIQNFESDFVMFAKANFVKH